MATAELNASKLIFSGTASRRGRNVSVTPTFGVHAVVWKNGVIQVVLLMPKRSNLA